jgi:nicotinamidase-related amidase
MIDIQNDYFRGGTMVLNGCTEAAIQAARILADFRRRGRPVIHIQHLSVRPGAAFFAPGTMGAEIHESVKPLSGEAVLQKNFPNAFRETALLEHLLELKVTTLVMCGMMTHMCVDSTVRAAFDLGYQCTVAGDACATRDLNFKGTAIPAEQVHAAFLAALSPIYARVMETGEFLSAQGD